MTRKYRLPPPGRLRNNSSCAGLPQPNRIETEVVLLGYYREPVTPDHWDIWGHLFNRVFRALRKQRVASPQIFFWGTPTCSPSKNILTDISFAVS